MSATRNRRLAHAANWVALAGLVFVPLILYPIVGLVLLSVHSSKGITLSAYAHFFADPASVDIIKATVYVLIVSGASATVVGVALAALIFFFPYRGSPMLVRIMELFVAFPSFLVAFTLIFIYGTEGSVNVFLKSTLHLQNAPLDFLFGFGGVVLAQVIYFTPFVVRPTLTAFMLIDHRVIEAARSLGAGPAMVAWRVVLPMALPGVVAGSILCFLLVLNEFGILLVLGSAKLVTLPLAIYSSATIDLDLERASAEAVILLAASIAVFLAYRHATRAATRSHTRA